MISESFGFWRGSSMTSDRTLVRFDCTDDEEQTGIEWRMRGPSIGTRPPSSPLGHVPIKGGSSGSDGCLERVPYASLMATALCLIGVILFAIMMSWGFNAAIDQTKRFLEIREWNWLDRIQIGFITMAVLMSVLTLYLLSVGIAATGSTREEMFKGAQARMGGRIACGVALVLSFVLFLIWLFVLSVVAILCALFIVFLRICEAAPPSPTDADCLDFSVGRPLVNEFSDSALKICGGNVQQFCALTATAQAWFLVAWIGAVLVLAGLCQFMITHAANYSHVNNANRYVELRDVAYESPPIGRPMDTSWYGHGGIPPPGSASSSRLANQQSDSVSQYAYGRPKKRPY